MALKGSFHRQTQHLVFGQMKFIGVGPPRTGTTWLHEVLADQSNLPRFNKETRFFDANYDKGAEWYAAHFDGESKLPAGEICPTYFCSPLARDRIFESAPQTKIVCSFRDPVARIFSLYKIKRAYGATAGTFEDALSRDPELTESSRYGFHFAKWRELFGKENVLAVFYEDLVQSPQAYVDRIASFIGMPSFRLTQSQLERSNSSEGTTHPRSEYLTAVGVAVADWLKARHYGQIVANFKQSKMMGLLVGGGDAIPGLPPVMVQRLRRMFRSEVDMLEGMVGRDLSAWKGKDDRAIESADELPRLA